MECMNDADRRELEARIQDTLAAAADMGSVGLQCMRYAMGTGGKRMRAALCLAACQLVDGDPRVGMHVATAVEFVQAATLLIDDLPCMDDATVRRGQPCAHLVYGEAHTLLAACRLLLCAEDAASKCPLDDAKRNAVLEELRTAAKRLAAGQAADLSYRDEPDAPDADLQTRLARVHKIHDDKTGSLIELSVDMGCFVCDTDDATRAALRSYSIKLGRAFQIADDIWDATGSEAELGKPCGKDAELRRPSVVAILGVEESRALVRRLLREAVDDVLALPRSRRGPDGAALTLGALALVRVAQQVARMAGCGELAVPEAEVEAESQRAV